MKTLLRMFLISLLALWLTSQIVAGFSYRGGFNTLIVASIVFSGINLFVRPILRLFFLPLNFITLGLFSWIVNVAALYLLILVVSQIKISAFYFPGASWEGFSAPPMQISILFALLASSFIISFISSFLQWLSSS